MTTTQTITMNPDPLENKASRTLYVGLLETHITDDKIKSHFIKFGHILVCFVIILRICYFTLQLINQPIFSIKPLFPIFRKLTSRIGIHLLHIHSFNSPTLILLLRLFKQQTLHMRL